MTATAFDPWGGHDLAANDNRPSPCASHGKPDDSLPLVVALSGAAGSGKSTAAQYLVDMHGYTRVRFAGQLKAMCAAIGMGRAEIEGELKEVPAEWLGGKSPRQFMQLLGTEFGRKYFGDDFWVRLWRCEAESVLETGGRVVVDDCRFPNEAAAVRKLGGDIYRLAGRGGIAGSHESERMDFTADVHIDNAGTQAELYAQLNGALRRWG